MKLKLIFQACLESGKFPNEWKKANVVPVHKKGDKQILKNYRPISLLPIAGKIFERLLYDKMFEFFIANNLISKNQSGFRPGDSCINQLLSITHEIYQSFDDNLEVRAVFLDISKAFDKVWHKGLIFKLKENGISDKILNIITDFLSFRKQRVVLNGQASPWVSIEAGVPQGSILGPLLFLIYINDLSDDLSTTVKLFADDTSLFSIVQNVTTSASHLNNDLSKINNWAFQWKMSFNPDPSKQAQEVLFSRKIQKTCHPSIYFNNKSVKQVTSQKHLGLILDSKLNFQEHLQNILNKVNKTIGLLRKLQNILPREPLLTIYKSFVRPHLDYGDVIYDQRYNNSFHQKLESIQYNAALAITGAIRGSSREKLYQELGLESLKQRRWFRKLCYFFKITKNQSPKYLSDKMPTTRTAYRTRNNIGNIPRFNVKHNFFKNSFFPSSVIEWNNLDKSIRSSENLALFKKSILQFIRPTSNRTFNCLNPIGIKLITRLRLGLSHLRDHKFKHNFLDCLNPICYCGQDIETSVHYLLHCPIFSDERSIFFNNIRRIDENILSDSDPKISDTLLFGNSSFNDTKNTSILNTTIDYILSTKRFDVPLTNF